MKKITLSVVSLLAVIAMVFCLSACGQTPEQRLNSYIESEAFQSQLDSMKSSFGSMMDMDVRAEENKLVYEITYKSQIDSTLVDAVKSQLDTTFQAMASTYEGIADEIKEVAGIDNPAVVISILNADKTEITTIEFGTSK